MGDEHYQDPPVRQLYELDVLQGNAAYGWRHYDAKIIGYLGEDLAGSGHEMLGTVVGEKVAVDNLSIARRDGVALQHVIYVKAISLVCGYTPG